MESAAEIAQSAILTEASPDERRVIGRALKLWEEFRGSRAFPRLADFQTRTLTFDVEDMFVVALRSTEHEDEVVLAGATLTDALGRDPTGAKAVDVLPSSTEMGLSFCRAAADMKKPIADVGRFTNENGDDIQYRCMLLPTSDDGETVDHIVGAFSFRRQP